MPRTDETDDDKALDIAALNALVCRIEDFLRAEGLAEATQKAKAEAIGLAHQSDARKLLRKQHAPGLDKVQQIATKTKIPAWYLLMSKEEEATLRAVGLRFPLFEKQGAPSGGLGADSKSRTGKVAVR